MVLIRAEVLDLNFDVAEFVDSVECSSVLEIKKVKETWIRSGKNGEIFEKSRMSVFDRRINKFEIIGDVYSGKRLLPQKCQKSAFSSIFTYYDERQELFIFLILLEKIVNFLNFQKAFNLIT